jgi:signal transduction histidine kinase
MNSRVEALEKQLAEATHQREKIDALNDLAWALIKPNPQRTLTLSQEARQLAQSGDFAAEPYLEGLAAANSSISQVHYFNAEYDITLTQSFEILQMLEGQKLSVTHSRVYNTIASTYRILGNISEALDYYFKQLHISEETGDREGYATALIVIGTIYHDMGQDHDALEYFRKSRPVFEEIGDTYWVALGLNNISYVHLRLGSYERALARGQESLAVARTNRHPRMEILASGTLGEIHEYMGESDQALHYFQSSISLAREAGYPDQEIDGLRLLGQFYVKSGRPDEAITTLEEAMPLAQKINHRHFLYQCHQLLYQAYQMKDDPVQALAHHEQFFAIRESVFSEESSQKLRNLEVLYRTENAQKEAQYYASLYQIEQDRRQLTEVLNQVGRSLTSTLNLNEVLNNIMAHLRELVDYDRGALLLMRRQVELEFVAAYGYESTDSPLHYTFPIDTQNEQDIFVRIYSTAQPLHLDHVAGYEGWKQIGSIPTPGSWLGVPLIRNNEVIGMLSLARSEIHPYSDEAISLAAAFATQAAIALENARLYNKTKQFNDQLEYEVGRRTEALREAYEQLERLDHTKSEFIAITAHELRTPITVLKGYSQLLQSDRVITANEYHANLVTGIVSGANRLHDIVNTMLLMIKIDNHSLEIHSEPLLINRLLRQITGELDYDLANRRLTLTLDEQIDDLPAIEGDGEVLEVVFSNIIINAIKYTPDGGRIHIHGRHWDGHPPRPDLPTNALEIVVSDTGIGIDPNVQELIFTKFYQTGEVALHSSGRTKFKGGGPGLGLAISRGIIEAHRGLLWAESTGHDEQSYPGSHFHIVLPLP